MADTVRLPRLRPDHATGARPTWAAITDRFYADSFDGSSEAALVESIGGFADLTPEEQAFHQAHLAFRQVQALADIHAALKGIERGLAGLDPQAVAALKHLPGVRKALVVIARGQQEMLELMESGGGRVSGEEDDEEEPSDLSDAVEDEAAEDAVEDEDHGHGDAVEPDEILPPGAA